VEDPRHDQGSGGVGEAVANARSEDRDLITVKQLIG